MMTTGQYLTLGNGSESGSVGRDGVSAGQPRRAENITSALLLGSSSDPTLASRNSDQRCRAETLASAGPPWGVDKAWIGPLIGCT